MWKIQTYSHVKFANFVYFCITRGKALLHDCIFHILRYFSTKLHNFTKFRMLFPAVLMISTGRGFSPGTLIGWVRINTDRKVKSQLL